MKAHLGCGKRYLEGYVHVDISEYSHIDHVHDIKTLPMFEDNSLGLIYASHVLEYFDKEEVVDVLKEWRRKLKIGGILRLAVPDFEVLAELYRKNVSIKMISGPILGIWDTGNTTIQHKVVYDYSRLRNLLEFLDFTDIHRWDWRNVFVDELSEFDDYSQAYIPHMDKDNGTLISLNVEGTRGW